MDIEEFYDADERRRHSPEIELGTEWRDASGVRYELSWVQDTGELYIMREPVPQIWEDPLGDMGVQKASIDEITVAIVGAVTDRQELERIFAGWEEAMTAPNSVSWFAERIRAAGVAPLSGPDAERLAPPPS